ncbi:MAG TPA: FumA C-terminus/TtdB family hydratase beta subunit, partial [Candidatus Ozemobacteraceae bacterium]|nr:FumA C-terminus/TtdB family hydratase beta subunit [Candidatus Ozemobacteraceae bacterium]
NVPGALTRIDLSRGQTSVRESLATQTVGSLLLLSGFVILARDLAHQRWRDLIQAGRPLPDYLRQYPIWYAGPARTPPGMPIGSVGPTTSGRMDQCFAQLMAQGGSWLTIGKGQRSATAVDACRAYGGWYLGTIGGVAALLAREHVSSCELIDHADLGMEAVYRVRLRDLPVFVVIDHHGNHMY